MIQKQFLHIVMIFFLSLNSVQSQAAEATAFSCLVNYIDLHRVVDTEFDKILSSVTKRADRKLIIRKAKELRAAAMEEAWAVVEKTCQSIQCTAEAVSSILTRLFENTLGKLIHESSENLQYKRFQIATGMFIKATVISTVLTTVISFITTGGSIEFKELHQLIFNPINSMITGWLYTAYGGDLLGQLMGSKTSAIAAKKLEMASRKNNENADAGEVGQIDPVVLRELQSIESFAQAQETRTLRASERITQSISAFFAPFNIAAKQVLNAKNSVLQEAAYLNFANVILNVLKTRFESSPDSRYVSETFSAALWAHIPEDISQNELYSVLTSHYQKIKIAIQKLHLKIYETELTEELFASQVAPFLNKLFYPQQLGELISHLKELQQELPEEETADVTLAFAQRNNRLGLLVRR